MKAVTYQGIGKIEVKDMPEPIIQHPEDLIIQVTKTALCGSDLHLYAGYFAPFTKQDQILGHEAMGIVIDTGKDVKKIKPGDKVVVSAVISCGRCEYCLRGEYSLCDTTNKDNEAARRLLGYTGAGIFGYSDLYGDYPGGQAEFLRVPYGDVNALPVPSDIDDERVLFLSDIFPTGYMAAENAAIPEGGTVVIWGAGPVGLFALKSSLLLGAGRVIMIDLIKERLDLAKKHGAETISFDKAEKITAILKEMTGGRGPDSMIDAVGMEADIGGLEGAYDKARQTLRLEMDRPGVLRHAIYAARKGTALSIPGVYGGLIDKFPMGIAFTKGLTLRMGQTHIQRYFPTLLEKITNNQIDPTFLITHRLTLDEAPEAYRIFQEKQEKCIKVVFTP